MVRSLKKCTEDGTRYARLPGIDALLAQLLTADAKTILTRAAITDRHDVQYLPPEALVHLTRHALRMQDSAMANSLLPRLGERAAAILLRTVRETNAFNAADVRDETLSRLYELFADDLRNPEEGLLDYYEVRFNSAFATLRAGVVRETLTTHAPMQALEPLAGDDERGGGEASEISDPDADAALALAVHSEQLHRLVHALPPEEREAVVWKYFYDLKTESTDPTERTVASICGVSGSEIRSRLRSAYARLKKRMEG